LCFNPRCCRLCVHFFQPLREIRNVHLL
jgi:hypothetical protein